MKNINLYFHIPYCKAKCRFCSFYVIPGRKSKLEDYFDALGKEILSKKELLHDYKVNTIYVGGGTPSLVDSIHIVRTLELIRKNYNISTKCEISVECNPETITEEKINSYNDAGVNRISIGLQSTNDQTLKFLGRLYTFNEFKAKYNIIKKSKIKNINLDLIFGIPEQTLNDWQKDLENIVSLNPNHISTYSLEVDEDSIFGYLEKKGRFKKIDERIDRRMYVIAKKYLNQNQFNQYEISNFSKKGYECNHNLNIWNGEDYIGFGASAHSRINKTRYNNINSLERYIELINLKEDTRENIQELSKIELLKELLLLGLRKKEGIDVEMINRKLKIDYINDNRNTLNNLRKANLIEFSSELISLTNKGQDLENLVGYELIKSL